MKTLKEFKLQASQINEFRYLNGAPKHAYQYSHVYRKASGMDRTSFKSREMNAGVEKLRPAEAHSVVIDGKHWKTFHNHGHPNAAQAKGETYHPSPARAAHKAANTIRDKNPGKNVEVRSSYGLS
jgi:hypothetical protein